MERTVTSSISNTLIYALSGASFGLLFPILATLIRVLESRLPLSISSIIAVQSTDALLWIIDTAPVFLCIFAIIAGRRQDGLERLNNLLKLREQELESAQLALEARIDERSQELTSMSRQIQERAAQLNNVADGMRQLLSIQGMDRLLHSAASTFSRQFDYYHVSIYLLDEQKQYAVLQASNNESGPNAIRTGLRLKIGDPTLVDIAIRSGQARFINDVRTDPLFNSRPELAGTRSELVLPLRFGELILGAIDLQSDVVREFPEEYVSVLSTLADILTIAIQNANLDEKSRRTIHEVEASARQVSATEWSEWMESIRVRGYRYDGIRAEPLKESAPSPSQDQSLSIPLHLRGRLIGNLRIKPSESSPSLTEDDRAIAEATAERAAFALEGARLLDEAQKRAARESFLSEVAARLSTSFQLDSILRDTVEELGHTLKGSSVSFQLVNPSELTPVESSQADDAPSNRKKPQ